jgi:serine/threonine protein kinase
VTKRDLVLHLLPRDDRLIQILRDVKHPFVLLVFDVVMMEEGSVAFLYEGGCVATLREVADNNEYLLEEDALVITKFLLLALKELHEKLVVFGRLCLENVLMCNLSLIKLGYNHYEEQIPLDQQSPEMLRGERVTPASDIFAVGVILYRLVYGVLPF